MSFFVFAESSANGTVISNFLGRSSRMTLTFDLALSAFWLVSSPVIVVAVALSLTTPRVSVLVLNHISRTFSFKNSLKSREPYVITANFHKVSQT